MAKNVDAGMLAMASAYVMNRRLGPETGREEEVVTKTCPTEMLGPQRREEQVVTKTCPTGMSRGK